MEGVGNLSFRFVRGPKVLRDAVYGSEKVEKTLTFCDLFILCKISIPLTENTFALDATPFWNFHSSEYL